MEGGVGTDCPSLPCSTRCLFARASQQSRACAVGFQVRRRREVEAALGSNAPAYETGMGQSKSAKLLHAPPMAMSLRQGSGEQVEEMRLAARGSWTV